MYCKGTRPNGDACVTRSRRGSDFCKKCDPWLSLSEEEQQKRLKKEAQLKRDSQREEILAKERTEAMLEIRDLESLRRVELLIGTQIANGDIDPRAGSPIIQILKHQQDLLGLTVGKDENLNTHERELAMELAKKMAPEEMLKLLANFGHGMKMLVKEIREQPEATKMKLIEAEVINVKTPNSNNKLEQGLLETPSTSAELF